MFSAVVLVCVMNANEEVLSCGPSASKSFFETYNECRFTVEEAIETGVFTEVDYDRQLIALPVKYRCIDWEAQET